MSKVFMILTLAGCLTWGCTNPQNGADASAATTEQNKERKAINSALKKYEEPSQFFTVPAGKPASVTGRKGTRITFDPADLATESGKPVTADITVELKELHNQGDLFRTGAQTVSDGKLLVSGGAYYIGMRSGGEQVRLKDGKQLAVRFPRIAKEKMNLFYGERDASGTMNWKQTPAVFTTAAIAKPEADTIKTTKTKSEIDAIMDYTDSGYVERPEAQQEHAKRRKDYAIVQKLYDVIAVKQMGWINCDRFWNYENIAELSIGFPLEDDVQHASVYLVFEDINSVMQGFATKEKGMLFANLPVGQHVKLVAFAVKAGNIRAYTTKLTIVKEEQITLDLKATTEQDFKKIIGK
jgi:hypothetical protein